MNRLNRPRIRARGAGRGFTLIETSMAMVIIAFGVVSLLELLAAGTMSNTAGTELTTAINLANNIHEISVGLLFKDPADPTNPKEGGGTDPTQYNDIWDMNGDVYSPPLDVTRHTIGSYVNWEQDVSVQSVDQNSITTTVPNNTSIPTARITVQVKHNGKLVYQETWLVAAPNS